MEVARWCRGDWKLLSVVTKVSFDLVQRFLEYAAAFLDSLGNYRVSVPRQGSSIQ